MNILMYTNGFYLYFVIILCDFHKLMHFVICFLADDIFSMMSINDFSLYFAIILFDVHWLMHFCYMLFS